MIELDQHHQTVEMEVIYAIGKSKDWDQGQKILEDILSYWINNRKSGKTLWEILQDRMAELREEVEV